MCVQGKTWDVYTSVRSLAVKTMRREHDTAGFECSEECCGRSRRVDAVMKRTQSSILQVYRLIIIKCLSRRSREIYWELIRFFSSYTDGCDDPTRSCDSRLHLSAVRPRSVFPARPIGQCTRARASASRPTTASRFTGSRSQLSAVHVVCTRKIDLRNRENTRVCHDRWLYRSR